MHTMNIILLHKVKLAICRPLIISLIILPISDQTIVSHRSGNHNLISVMAI